MDLKLEKTEEFKLLLDEGLYNSMSASSQDIREEFIRPTPQYPGVLKLLWGDRVGCCLGGSKMTTNESTAPQAMSSISQFSVTSLKCLILAGANISTGSVQVEFKMTTVKKWILHTWSAREIHVIEWKERFRVCFHVSDLCEVSIGLDWVLNEY